MRALVVVLVVLASTDARAEMWGSSMGELLRDAKTIELVQVEAFKDGVVTGKLVEAFRSKRTKGARVSAEIHGLATPAIGERVLIICDLECPRAAGVLRDGWFQLRAQQPMDGAVVWPNVVTLSAIPVLMTGKPAPTLCVRGTIALLDDTRRPAFELQVAAGDGKGKATIEKRTVSARIGGAFGSRDDDVSVMLGELGLSARSVKRTGACLVGEFVPNGPIARTQKGLDRAIGDKVATAQLFARGTLVVARGTKLAVGKHAIQLLVDENGQLAIASKLVTGALDRIGRIDDKLQLEFSVDEKRDFYPTLRLELAIARRGAGDTAAEVVGLVSAQRSVRVRVSYLVSTGKGAPPTTMEIGDLTLAYVPER